MPISRPRSRSFARPIARPISQALSRAILPLALALAACRGSSDPVTLAPGEPWLAVEVLGGWTNYRVTTFVDSATGRWEKIRCDPTISSSPCRRGTLVASGSANAQDLHALFAAVQGAAFNAVPSDIPGGSGPEVDGTLFTMTIAREGAPRSVQWRSGAPLPAALEAAIAHLETIVGNEWRRLDARPPNARS